MTPALYSDPGLETLQQLEDGLLLLDVAVWIRSIEILFDSIPDGLWMEA